jgi:hypothetical protein
MAFSTWCAVERKGAEWERRLMLLERTTVRPELLERLLAVVRSNRP